jgi:hypothetical protein
MADESLTRTDRQKPLVQSGKSSANDLAAGLAFETHESFVNPSWKSPMAAGLKHVAEAPERFWDNGMPKTRT